MSDRIVVIGEALAGHWVRTEMRRRCRQPRAADELLPRVISTMVVARRAPLLRSRRGARSFSTVRSAQAQRAQARQDVGGRVHRV